MEGKKTVRELYELLRHMRHAILDLYDNGNNDSAKLAWDDYVKLSKILWGSESSLNNVEIKEDGKTSLDTEVQDCINSGRNVLRHGGLDWCLLTTRNIYCPHQQYVKSTPNFSQPRLFYCGLYRPLNTALEDSKV